MAQTCGFCQDEIGDVPKIELLCHHFFHTNCFLLNMGDQCAVCEEPFFHDAEGQEEEVEVASVHSDETTGHQRVLNLYNTNRTFRRDIKTYLHAVSSVSKPRNEFQKLLARKKAELAEPYALIKARYEGLYSTKKDEIVQSEVYKNYKKTDARMRRLYMKLTRDYRVYSYHFPTLQTLPGLKRLRKPNRWRYYTRPLNILQRALRLWLPRY